MKQIPKALKDGIIDLHFTQIPCAVLKDGTRLITTSGLQKSLGKANTSGGKGTLSADLPPFLNVNALKPFIDQDLTSSISPVEFYMSNGSRAYGYSADTLPKICEVFLKARDAGVLTPRQLHHAAIADLIIRSLAKVGITALVDEATGYQEFRDKTALQALLDKYLTQEAAKWAKTFPDEFYLGIFRLKGWNPAKEIRFKPGVVARYTNDLVYKRLVPGLLDVLEEKNPKQESGNRRWQHHRFLSRDQGIQHLKGHLFMIQKLMQSSRSWDEFMEKMNALLPYSETTDIFIKDLDEKLKE